MEAEVGEVSAEMEGRPWVSAVGSSQMKAARTYTQVAITVWVALGDDLPIVRSTPVDGTTGSPEGGALRVASGDGNSLPREHVEVVVEV